MRARHIAAIAWLALVLAAGAFVAERFANSAPIETDLLALLPHTEQTLIAESAFKSLSGQLGERVLFLVGHANAASAGRAARMFCAHLESSSAFSRVIVEAPRTDPQSLIEIYQPYRAGLLTANDKEALIRPDYRPEATLLRRLYQPFPTGIATDLAIDPFGFFQHWLGQLPLMQSRMGIHDGLLSLTDKEATWVLVIAEPVGGAFDAATQSRVVTAVNAAESQMDAAITRTTLLRTGAIFYAEAARTSAKREVDVIGGGSLAGIVLMMWLLFRSISPLAFSLLTVACGLACALATVLMMGGRIHLITLVFGASLIGEAVDYAIQYFAARLDAGERWQARSTLTRMLPGLGVALATSLIGYGAIALTPFPAIQQIALFAFAGLSAAWISVVLFLPLLAHRPGRTQAHSIRLPQHLLELWQAHATPRRVLGVTLALLLVSLPGWLRLTTDDDVRQLVARPASLVTQEDRIRSLAGANGGNRFFLVEGATAEQALQREEALTARLHPLVGKVLSGYAAVSAFVPSPETQAENRQLLARVLPAERTTPLFARSELRGTVTTQWQDALAHDAPLTLGQWRNAPIAKSMQHQMLQTPNGGTALIVTLSGDDPTLDLAAIAAGLPGVSAINKPASVSALFAQYRHLVAWWLLLAALLVLAVLMVRYGPRLGAAVLVPTLVALGVALGSFGWLGVPVTLISLLALMLVLCVGVNYSIFIVEAGERAPASFAGVLLSAATTLLSFGLLAFSSMPALHQFGLVLLSGIATAVALAPMSLTLRDGR